MKSFSQVIYELQEMQKEIESEIDGGEECLGRDQQLSAWASCAAEAADSIKCLRKAYNDLTTDAQCE